MGPPAGSLDTSDEAAARLVEGWRCMAPAQRAALVDGWSRDVRRLAELGIRQRRPAATRSAVRIELGRLLYGDAVVTEDVEAAVHAGDGQVPGRP
jgi:hypothetical protein